MGVVSSSSNQGLSYWHACGHDWMILKEDLRRDASNSMVLTVPEISMQQTRWHPEARHTGTHLGATNSTRNLECHWLSRTRSFVLQSFEDQYPCSSRTPPSLHVVKLLGCSARFRTSISRAALPTMHAHRNIFERYPSHFKSCNCTCCYFITSTLVVCPLSPT